LAADLAGYAVSCADQISSWSDCDIYRLGTFPLSVSAGVIDSGGGGGIGQRRLIIAFEVGIPNLNPFKNLERNYSNGNENTWELSPGTTDKPGYACSSKSGKWSVQCSSWTRSPASPKDLLCGDGSEEEAAKAMADCNGKELDGRVTESQRSQTPR